MLQYVSSELRQRLLQEFMPPMKHYKTVIPHTDAPLSCLITAVMIHSDSFSDITEPKFRGWDRMSSVTRQISALCEDADGGVGFASTCGPQLPLGAVPRHF